MKTKTLAYEKYLCFSERTSSSITNECNQIVFNEETDPSANQLSGVIICLTLRKILNSRWFYLQKFTFGLIRGLYKDSIRKVRINPSQKKNSKLPLAPLLNLGNRRSYSAKNLLNKNNRCLTIQTTKKKAYIVIKSRIQKILKKTLSKAFQKFYFITKTYSKMKTKLTVIFKKIVFCRLKNHFSLFAKHETQLKINKKSLNAINYARINKTYTKCRLMQLADSFM